MFKDLYSSFINFINTLKEIFILIKSNFIRLLKNLIKKNDMIYHLAAVVGVKHVMENPVDTIRVNTLGSENVLHSCSKYGKKVLIASTSEVYGKVMQYNKSSEGLDEENDSVFGKSKERNCESPTFDVTTKKITNKKTMSINGVISIEKDDLLSVENFIS